MKNKLLLKIKLLKFIELIVEIYNISKEEIDYYSDYYDGLDEEEFMFRLELIFGSYIYINNISVDERISFASGMGAFVKVNRSKVDTDFSTKSDEYKKNTTLEMMKSEYSKEKNKLMYRKGIDAGIDLDNEYLKKKEAMEKVRTRTLS